MPIPWERPLTQGPSSRSRLTGIDVFHDFVWREVFGHDRAAFRNGQSLTRMIRRDCPAGKQPTLILTTLPLEHARTIETVDRFIAIVPIHDYLASSRADPASTYYARTSGTPVTGLSTLHDVPFSKQDLQLFLESNLTESVLRDWMEVSPSRRELLSELATAGLAPPAEATDIASALRDVSQIDDKTLRALVDVLRLQPVSTYAQPLLELLTSSSDGRIDATRALAAKLPQRIADVRAQLVEYESLVETAGTQETDVQLFLERHPWIVGLHYVRARGRMEVPRGTIDFVLDRFDGFFDIVELKGPGEQIVVERDSSEGDLRPGSPCQYTLSKALGNALAQAHLYRSILIASNDLRAQLGLSDTRQPRIVILIGQAKSLTAGAREVLRELNLSLHRVEIIPYDLVSERMSGLLDNLENLITTGGTPSE
jgi:hypothetical protein